MLQPTRLGKTFVAGLLLLTLAVGCNPLQVALNNTIYNINIPLGLNGNAGLLNPLGAFTLLWANITNFLGLGFISPSGGVSNPNGGAGPGLPPPIIFGS